jgi:hypothetical protein
LLESHISYPVLCHYRSNHSNQSWLAAVTAILDTSALVLVGLEGIPPRQAQLTFAIARHAVADLAQIFNTPPRPPRQDRLPPEAVRRLRAELAAAGVPLRGGPDADQRLGELRRLYEPYATALAEYLVMALPQWLPATGGVDNWQTSAWERIASWEGKGMAAAVSPDEHF